MQQKTSFDDATVTIEDCYDFSVARVRLALGKRIAELRERANLSQQALADEADVGKATIQRLEGGKHWPEWDTLAAIAGRLNVDVDQFFTSLMEDVALPEPEQAIKILSEFVKRHSD
jgi:transcriptional regulator with XRE-family HTH domain